MKKLYVRPCMYVVEVETMTLLAGSDGTIHNTDKDVPNVKEDDLDAEPGGNCAKDDLYNIWETTSGKILD